MRTFRFQSELFLPNALEKVFEFFADAHNLQKLTPPWLHFKILNESPVEMKKGTLIDYSLRIHGVPVRWQSEITLWEPPHRFVDSQTRGPYRLWNHEHSFSSTGEGTRVSDSVEYAVMGGILVQKLFVAPDLKKIFNYRSAQLKEIFKSSGSADA
ncbi:MAG: CDP-paratose 2-epimerase [Deltaproteobacteria bacterium]|nr:CDP-paratose 2-epimerase [Deltaproteobacteria bacterium]